MHRNHDREILISKSKLISKLTENKEAHIKDYEEAVEAYKLEARKQIDKAMTDLLDGSLKVEIKLITPKDRRTDYDKVIEMFNWEIEENVKLTQDEFNEYVHNENQEAVNTRFLNASYKGR